MTVQSGNYVLPVQTDPGTREGIHGTRARREE